MLLSTGSMCVISTRDRTLVSINNRRADSWADTSDEMRSLIQAVYHAGCLCQLRAASPQLFSGGIEIDTEIQVPRRWMCRGHLSSVPMPSFTKPISAHCHLQSGIPLATSSSRLTSPGRSLGWDAADISCPLCTQVNRTPPVRKCCVGSENAQPCFAVSS
jgi:hypothetical protein